MPLIDKPLAELLKYQGINPKPENFDAFWDAQLAGMHRLDPQLELRPNPIQCASADCFDLFFTGVGGSRIHSKYLRPKGLTRRHPAILIFHGYSGNCGDWFSKLPWVSQGYSVLAMDCRGQGGISQDLGSTTGTTLRGHIIRGLDDKPEKLLFAQIFLDAAQLARIVMDFPEVDPTRVGVVGGSQGGGLTLACAALEPRIKLAASQFPFLCDYQRVWEMDQAKQAYEELSYYFRAFDPHHEREKEIFTQLGHIDCQHLAPRIKARILMGIGLMDTICPPSTQFAAFNKITSEKRYILYHDFAHETLPDWSDHVMAFMEGL